MMILKLGFYLMSKFAITSSFTIIYVYTAEMFPTEVRQTLKATASTVGRTGSMIAPHTILLVGSKSGCNNHGPKINIPFSDRSCSLIGLFCYSADFEKLSKHELQ